MIASVNLDATFVPAMSGGGTGTTTSSGISSLWCHRPTVHAHDMALIQRHVQLCTDACTCIWAIIHRMQPLHPLPPPGHPPFELVGNARGFEQGAWIARAWPLELCRKKHSEQHLVLQSVTKTNKILGTRSLKMGSAFLGEDTRCPLCISVQLDSPRSLWIFFQKFSKHPYVAHTAVVHTVPDRPLRVNSLDLSKGFRFSL
jgi:hypothetical protein